MSHADGYWPRPGHIVLDAAIANSSQPPIGLIAGWGRFPVEVAQQLVRSGHRVACVAIQGHASTDLESICDHVIWSGVGKLGTHLKYFRRGGVEQVTMAGKLFKADILYGGSILLRHFPDLTCLRTFAPLLFGRKRDARDDSLLLSVISAYEKRGMTICSATELAPELLVNQNQFPIENMPPTLQNDIRVGWQVAKQMGAMDIGQTVTIKDGVVLAVEAIEGTDACIERTGQLCRRGGWTMVKVSKPQQDMRFDVPTVGPQTIQLVAGNGGKAIVIESEKTIMVDRRRTMQMAMQSGIKIVALDDQQVRLIAADKKVAA